MKLRNPKKDPEAGDIVEVRGDVRTVIAISERGAISYRVGEEERLCCRKSWAGWAAGMMAPKVPA